MNPFKVNDLVKNNSGSRNAGKVIYIACKNATIAGGKTCDKKTCNCFVKDYVWVEWTDSKVFSYEHTELAFDGQQSQEIVAKEIKVIGENESKNIPTIPNLTLEKLDFDLYNGITQVRYTRDGIGYIVNVGANQETIVPAIEEKELDFDAYNNKGVVRKKK